MLLKLYFLRRFNKHRYCFGLQQRFVKNIAKGICFSDASQKRCNIPLIAADLKTSLKKMLPKPKFLVVRSHLAKLIASSILWEGTLKIIVGMRCKWIQSDWN